MVRAVDHAMSSRFPDNGDSDAIYELLAREVHPIVRKLKEAVNELSGELSDIDDLIDGLEAEIIALTIVIDSKAGKTLPITTVIDAAHVLVSGNADYKVRCTNAAGCVVTVNPGIFTEGQIVHLRATLDQLELVAGGGVTINTSATLFSRAAHSDVFIHCLNDDGTTFDVTGDMEL